MNRRFILILFVLLALIAASVIPGSDILMPGAAAQVPGAGAQRAPAIRVDKFDSVYLSMSVATKPASAGTPGSQVMFMRSDDSGTSWDNFPLTRNLSNSDGEAFGPSMGVNFIGKSRTYIVYHDDKSGQTQVYLAATKKGTKFKKGRNITPHNGGAFVPRLAMDASVEALNIVWGDTLFGKRVVYTRSTDMGETFSELVDVSRSSGAAFEPEIAVDRDDNIFVVWEDTAPGNSAIMMSRSTDHGASFSAPLPLSQYAGNSVEPQVATDEAGRVYVVWSEVRADSTQLILARSTDHGETFSAPQAVTNNNGADIRKAAIVARGNNVYMAFNNDESRSRQVYVVRSGNAGESFGEPVQVSNANRDRGRGHSAAITLDSQGVLHAAWIDSSVIGNDEGLLFYSQSSNGRNFSSPKMLLAIVVSNGR